MKVINQIIIIDDNKIDLFINQKICSLVFEKANIKTFNCSVTAVDYFKKPFNEPEEFSADKVDIILLDINIPVINGFEFLKEIEKTNLFTKNKVEVYFLSSSNLEKDINEALSIESCSGYIEKPLTKDKLINVMNLKDKKEYFLLNNNTNIRTNRSKDVA